MVSGTPIPPMSTDPPRSLAARAALVFLAWTAVGLLMGQQTALTAHVRGEVRTWWSMLAPAMLGAWIWAAYTPVVVPVTRWLRRTRARGALGWAACLGGHATLALALTVVDAVIYAAARPYLDGTATTFARVFASVLLLDVLLYAIVVALVETTSYAALFHERDRAAAALARTAAALQGRLDEARLHALESQLRPHFLYNTLNLIAELVHDEPDAADEMLTRLGFLLRRACHEGAHLVPLTDELAVVRAYTDILTRRFGARVTVDVDVPDPLGGCLVPVFSLQPLVENAYRHGAERRERATALSVRASARGGRLVLSVRDRGVGPGAGRPDGAASGTGVGLRNTRERLAALFGDAAGLTIEVDGDGAVATLWMPTRIAPSAPQLRPALTFFGD